MTATAGGLDALSGSATRWQNIWLIDASLLAHTLATAGTLAVLLSIDTLKTCVILDTLTHSRHQSNREIRRQGIGNLVSAIFGGMAGADTAFSRRKYLPDDLAVLKERGRETAFDRRTDNFESWRRDEDDSERRRNGYLATSSITLLS